MVNKKNDLCLVCGKNNPKDILFCEDCLSQENREKTFNQRVLKAFQGDFKVNRDHMKK